MTADSKFFGPAPDMAGQAGGARFDAKRVSDQVWILEVRPLVDKPGTKVTGDQVVAVLQWIAATVLGIPSDQPPPPPGEPLPRPERHLRLIPNPPPDPDGGDAA